MAAFSFWFLGVQVMAGTIAGYRVSKRIVSVHSGLWTLAGAGIGFVVAVMSLIVRTVALEGVPSKYPVIVVSKDPEAETTRLSGEGMPIEHDYLEPEDVIRLGSVDGAVILGLDGRCHTFGVILDEVASEGGDRARGARFNSSVRYQNMETAPSPIIVLSDDGTIDLLPRLMPRVHREEVAAAVDAFCQCCESTPVDGERFARLYDRVKRLEFYLNEEQCQRVNECHEQEMNRRVESGENRITERKLQPNPRMDGSYFWGE